MSGELEPGTIAVIDDHLNLSGLQPLIDDLFYGDSDAIRSFKWAQVLNRFQKSPAGGAEAAATV